MRESGKEKEKEPKSKKVRNEKKERVSYKEERY